MERIEIILKNIEINQVEEVFYNNIIFDKRDMISSHFFDEGKDIEYQDIKSLKDYFQISRTCSMYFKKIVMGIVLKSAFIIIACDKDYADITVNFDGEYFETCVNEKSELQELVKLLIKISQDGKAEEIVLGYEPAEDEDMKILEIMHGRIELFYKNIENISWIENVSFI